MTAIVVKELHKSYGSVRAVDGISFEVNGGEVFGFLGPNGAGKTTTIEIMEGYRKPDSGNVTVLDLDPVRDGYEIKERVGIMLQSTSLYPDLKVGEIVKLFSSYYNQSLDPRSLLEEIGLQDKKNDLVKELSGGQRRRLAFILTLVNNPELLFLDEPTAGLDPQTRSYVWENIRKGREDGKTVFLTTHYIEEAENLCDRVAIIDHGRIIALDTPRRLMVNLDVERKIGFITDGFIAPDKFKMLEGVNKVIQPTAREFILYTSDAQTTVKGLIALAEKEGCGLKDLRIQGAKLEDVFIKMTGRRIRE